MDAALVEAAFVAAVEKRGFAFTRTDGAARIEGAGARASFEFAVHSHSLGDDPVSEFLRQHPGELAVNFSGLRQWLSALGPTLLVLRVGSLWFRIASSGDAARIADAIMVKMARARASGRWVRARGVALERVEA